MLDDANEAAIGVDMNRVSRFPAAVQYKGMVYRCSFCFELT